MRFAAIRAQWPPLARLAVPLIFAELGWMAMSLVDTLMVGHLPHSALAMAAASLAQVLFNTFTWGMAGMLLGLDTLISQAFGAKEIDEANRWLWHGLLLALVLSALLVVLYTAGAEVLRWLPADRTVIDLAIPALRGLAWGVLPLLLYFTLRRYLQSAHHGKLIAFILISANLVNAAADWLLIFGHRWRFGSHDLAIPAFGVVGSSWATSFARVYMMGVALGAVWWMNRRHSYGLERTPRRIEWQHLRSLLLLGAPAGAQIFVEIAIFATVTALIATFGQQPLAGHEIALQCASTTFMVPYAISSATSVCVGHAIGRVRAGTGELWEAGASGWAGIGTGAVFMMMSSLVLICWPGFIARLFTPDAGVIAAAVPLLMIAAGFQFFDGVQVTATGALRGAGNTTAPLYACLTAYWLIALPVGTYLGFTRKLGAAGLWWGLLIGLVCAAGFLLAFWRRTLRSLQPR